MSIHEANRNTEGITYTDLLREVSHDKRTNDIVFALLAALVAEMELNEVRVPSREFLKTLARAGLSGGG